MLVNLAKRFSQTAAASLDLISAEGIVRYTNKPLHEQGQPFGVQL
jgi:hypothetical protein